MGKGPSSQDSGPMLPDIRAFNHGRDEAAAWLRMLGLQGSGRWHVEASIVTDAASRFELYVYAEEWGFAFHHGGRSSWIRVTDIPFVHGRDDFELVRRDHALATLATLLSDLEAQHGLRFHRSTSTVRSNVDGAMSAVRRWLHASRRD